MTKLCKRPGCENEMTKPTQSYCSRECAPYGHLREEGGRPRKKSKHEKSSEERVHSIYKRVLKREERHK